MPPTRFPQRPGPRLAHRLLPLPVLAGLAVAGTATLWGTSMAATKVALNDIHPVQLACLRFLVAGVLLSLLARGKGLRPDLGWRAASLGLTGVALFIGIQNLGLQSARAADATIVMGGALPAAAAMLGLLFLGENLEPLKMVGLLCSLTGISLVGLAMQGDETSSLAGIVLLLVAAVSGAVYATLGRKAYQTRHLLPLLAGAPCMAPCSWPNGAAGGARRGSPAAERAEPDLVALSRCGMLRSGLRALGVWLASPYGAPERADLQPGTPGGPAHGCVAGEQIQGTGLAGGLLVILGATLAVARWPVRAVVQPA